MHHFWLIFRRFLRRPLNFLASFVLFLMLHSCGSTSKVGFFRTLEKDTTIAGLVNPELELKIQKNDVLSITVSSLSKEVDDVFNVYPGTQVQGVAQYVPGFVVDSTGNVTLHMIGEFYVEGLTRKQLKSQIEKRLLPFMKEPIVTVQFVNHKVTVMGNVVKPQVLTLTEDRMSLLDVIVASGDVKDVTDVNRVLVIRENANGKQVKQVNLDDHSIFSSPWYYVQSNDIVYVVPNTEKIKKDEQRRTLQTTLSLAATAISLLIIIFNNIIK